MCQCLLLESCVRRPTSRYSTPTLYGDAFMLAIVGAGADASAGAAASATIVAHQALAQYGQAGCTGAHHEGGPSHGRGTAGPDVRREYATDGPA